MSGQEGLEPAETDRQREREREREKEREMEGVGGGANLEVSEMRATWMMVSWPGALKPRCLAMPI